MGVVECVCHAPGELLELQFAGSVRRPERREALLFLLYSIVEHGEDPTSEELSNHLFGPGRIAVTERLLALSNQLGLACGADGRWSLTPLGVGALRQRSILVPKNSVWHVRILDAGEIGTALVMLEEMPATRLQSAKDEHISINGGQLANDALAPWIGEAALPVNGGTEAIIEPDPEPTGVLLGRSPVEVKWYPIEGRIEFGQANWTSEAARCDVLELLDAVDSDMADLWDDEAGMLAINEERLEVENVFSRRLTFESSGVHVADVGLVDRIELSVPCGPVDKDDATNWVARRAVALSNQFQTAAVWDDTVRAAGDGLEMWGPEPPMKTDVAGRAKDAGDLPAYWNLVAPEDWQI